MISQNALNSIRKKYDAIKPVLNERSRRLWAASEAMVLGHGGISAVKHATGIAISTIKAGLKDLENPAKQELNRIRKVGGGRKKVTDKDPTLLADLDSLVEPTAMGDPENPLRWTCKSLRRLHDELKKMKHNLSHTRIGKQLKKLGYSSQANKKSNEGQSHPDRNAQFEYINNETKKFIADKAPIISVDTKKKELVGDFKNSGKEWRPKGNPEIVRAYDFKIKELGKVSPYGVYDITNNLGWVNIGIDNDTAMFAVESIRRWWQSMGKIAYEHEKKIMITADCGGSNSYRSRLWKIELQKLADESGLEIHVRHFPPGTSKWNKIEHKLFSFISQNWRGKPLISHAVIVNLIGATTTTKGLKVKCELDTNVYPKGIKISDEQLAQVNIRLDEFHGEWNYTIMPRKA